MILSGLLTAGSTTIPGLAQLVRKARQNTPGVATELVLVRPAAGVTKLENHEVQCMDLGFDWRRSG
jgi:hypothetical protein